MEQAHNLIDSLHNVYDKKILSIYKEIVLTNTCKKCATCCMHYPFIELTKSEVFSIKKATGMQPDVFTNRKGKNFEEYFMQFQNNGYCFFLNETDGSFSCDVYESRPHICKNYPSESTQQDVCDANSKRSLGEAGGS